MSAASPEPFHALRGMVMMMMAVAIFALMDTMSKYLTQFYAVTTIVWARYAFHTLLVVALLGPRLGLALVRTARPGAQLVRGLLLVGASLFFVGGVKHMPLAECSAISFLAPLLVTLMAAFVLKERVGMARWIAVGTGFLGVLVIIRPGTGVFAWASLLPLGTAVCFACYQILTRRLAGLESPLTSIFYSGLIGALLLSVLLPFTWSPPQSATHFALFAAIGIAGGLSHLMLIKAYDFAPASRLAPISYTQLIWAVGAGYVVFDAFPDFWSVAGIGVVMASGVYTATHQHLSERVQRAELADGPPGV